MAQIWLGSDYPLRYYKLSSRKTVGIEVRLTLGTVICYARFRTWPAVREDLKKMHAY